MQETLGITGKELDLDAAVAAVKAKAVQEDRKVAALGTFVPNYDVEVRMQAPSFTTLVPHTVKGKNWIAKNLATESWQWQFGSLAIEPRMAWDIVEAMEAAKLVVQQ